MADPLASLAEPSTSGLTNYGSESLSGNSSATIKPGIYSQITVSGNARLTHEQRHLHHRRRRASRSRATPASPARG